MFKLFVTVLVMSSTGSVSQNAFVTDYDDPVACPRMAKEINGSTEVTYGIHTARVFAKAACDTRQRGEALSPELRPS